MGSLLQQWFMFALPGKCDLTRSFPKGGKHFKTNETGNLAVIHFILTAESLNFSHFERRDKSQHVSKNTGLINIIVRPSEPW